MSASRQKWFRGLQSSSLFRSPPQNEHQRQTEILAYVELFGQFASEAFGDDINELVRSHYPHDEACLLDDVLVTFILHHPEHGHSILHALLSCVIDGTLIYNKRTPPFRSFISLFSLSSEKDLSEQWALACGETLRVLTHYNRPVYKAESGQAGQRCSESNGGASTSSSSGAISQGTENVTVYQEQEKRTPTRILTPWITDSLLAAPLGIRSDYFRWCGGVMGKYAAGGELKPPTTAGSRGPGKQPQLMPSTPRWAVANGAAVILSVCDDEVSRHETADLTAAAVPALLLPPPATALDEHLVAGLPPLEPYARLFHRYYAIATPGATQRLLLGLLEAPPSWAPDALDAAVQLVELLRAAEDYSSPVQLPRNWLHLHFLRPIGTAMAMRSGIAADAASALLFRVLSQTALLFPPPGHAQGVQMKISAAKASEEATARGIASLMCDHGPDVEWRICALWEAAYGLLPLNSSTVDLPELVVATPLQPPSLSWSLFRPLLRVLGHLTHGGPSEACLLRIFTATVEAILCRTFPLEEIKEQRSGNTKPSQSGLGGFGSKNMAMTELRAMVHALFTEACPSQELAARLLSMALAVCLSHDAVRQSGKFSKTNKCSSPSNAERDTHVARGGQRFSLARSNRVRGAVATFDSYIVAAVCALACEVQLLSFSAPMLVMSTQLPLPSSSSLIDMHGSRRRQGIQNGVLSAVDHARRFLSLLEALLALAPSTSYITPCSSNSTSGEIVAAAVVAAHISELLGKSKACMHALTAIMRCKWDSGLSTKATSLLALVERNERAVAAVVDNYVGSDSDKVIRGEMEVDAVAIAHEARIQAQSAVSQIQDAKHEYTLEACHECGREGTDPGRQEQKPVNVTLREGTGKALANIAMDASDVASLLCMDRLNRVNGNAGTLIKAVLVEKEDLSLAAVPLLWQRLIYSPEPPISGESTSAKQGWRQVVDALCNLVSAFPGKAASAIVLQAERDLQPWVGREDAQGLHHVWRLNKRIVSLLTELLRLHSVPEALKVVAKASDLLHRATDRMPVDGEACALPQLELLEAITTSAQVLTSSDSADGTVIDALSMLIKNRLPALVRCLSHDSAHVRALSMALLRDVLHAEPLKSRFPRGGDSCQVCESGSIQEKKSVHDWINLVEQCVAWEVHNLRAVGMSISMLSNAADSLGCSVPV